VISSVLASFVWSPVVKLLSCLNLIDTWCCWWILRMKQTTYERQPRPWVNSPTAVSRLSVQSSACATGQGYHLTTLTQQASDPRSSTLCSTQRIIHCTRLTRLQYFHLASTSPAVWRCFVIKFGLASPLRHLQHAAASKGTNTQPNHVTMCKCRATTYQRQVL
jgi:hypothetical protein